MSKQTSITKKQTFANSKPLVKGFTVVELLAVIVIVSLIASAAGGLYLGTFRKMQLEKGASDLMLAAKYARLAAIEKQKEFKLSIDKENGLFVVSFADTDEESGNKTDNVVSNPYSRPGKLADSVFFEEIKVAHSKLLDSEEEYDLENVILFTPYGTADTAEIKISNGKNSYVVSVSAATGKAKISQGSINEEEIMPDIIDLDAVE